MELTPWFLRKFERITDNGRLPGIVERLEGTPMRIRSKVTGTDPKILELKRDDKWSIKEEIGHLLDLEPLWYNRVLDLINGEEVLREADLTNRRTHEANHNETALEQLLSGFAQQRSRLLSIIREAAQNHLDASALHPRLRKPMQLIDLAFFVAEHDDHHLARMSHLKGF